jgi:putative transposase
MLVRKSYRYRIYPDAEQESLFRRTVGCCRFVYNLCLDQKKLEWHRSRPRRLTAFDQGKDLKALKAEVEWLREVPHHALVQAIADLHQAFTNFFERRADHPTLRRKGQNDSFRTRSRSSLRPTGSSCRRLAGSAS